LGRHRTIDRERLLDCAERVIIRAGAANLTLEAVAAEAGISKASVLYDYKTKKALIRALVERRVADEEEQVRQAISAQGDRPNATIRGFVSASTRAFSDEDRAVGVNLCAALAQDEDIREPVQKSVRGVLTDIERSSTDPQGARLAFLAIQGLMLLDWLSLLQFGPEDRDQVISQIIWLIDQTPTPSSGDV